ncbi:hypothetical protein APY03_0896 [Variovorax sp. WDL1]|nr:hypothetical protein APY03_0896 [Variovorax sp. WDL1]
MTTERPGACPTGEAWIADVFCERGRAQVAFEVQMSPQPHAETLRRQRRYRDSGVRGAWFHAPMKSGIAPLTDKETPVFSLEDFEVGVPPRVKGFPLALPEFVEALLGKRLTYEVPEYTRTLHVGYLLGECWTCKRQLKHVCGMLDSAEQPWWYHPLTAASLSQTLAGVQAALSSSELAGLGLNRIEQYEINLGRRSKAPTSNICLHCNAPQPNEYVTEKLRAALGAPGELKNPPARVSSLLGAAVLTRTERGAGRWKLHDAAAVPSGHLAA